MQVKKKTILITGATSGIGYQLLDLLHSDNHLLIIARPSAKLDALTESFSNVSAYPADLADPSKYPLLAEEIINAHPTIDLLINNAAIQHTPGFLDEDFAYESITREVNTNLIAPCSLIYLLLPTLLSDNRETAIVNINSGLALAPKSQSALYCASKSALDSFSRSLSYQLEKTNIRVMQAFLPLVETRMTQGRGTGKLSAEYAAQKIIQGIESDTLINDIGKVKGLRMLMRVAPKLARKMMSTG